MSDFSAICVRAEKPEGLSECTPGGSFTLLRLRRDADLQKLMPDLSPAQRKLDVVLLHRVLLEEGLGITPAAVTAEQNISL